MRHLKVLGLTIVAAMAVMAFAGASSAPALDILCENNTSTPCTPSAKVAVNGIIRAEAITPKITASVEFHCEKSTTTLKITKNDTTNGATGQITGWTWTNCRTTNLGIFNVNCTSTTLRLPYHWELVTTTGVGRGTVQSGGSGFPGINVVCGGVLSCTFQNPHWTATFNSGNPASFTFGEVELEVGEGASCPEEAYLDATYVAESPTSALFVRSS